MTKFLLNSASKEKSKIKRKNKKGLIMEIDL